MKEKRREPRVCAAFISQCVDLTKKNNSYYIAIKDLSYNGIQILSDKKMPVGRNYKLNINLINEKAEAIVQVAWLERIPQSGRYCAGLKFMDIKAKSKRILENYINIIYMDSIHKQYMEDKK